MNNLGKVFRERRKSKKLTLSRLSEISGVSTSHLARVERDERFPSAHILMKLAEPLGFSETELLKLAGFMSQDVNGDRLRRLKQEIKGEIADAMIQLYKKVDTL